jgi:flagellar hook-associated protein 3 FlgL
MSPIRVNPNPTSDLLYDLNQVQQQQQNALLQIASGRRVNNLSDDPAASAQLVQNHDAASQLDSFQRNMTNLNGELQTADSTLSSVVTALQRAISLGVEGANGTLSDTDRAAVAQEVQGIQNQLISLANVSYQGHYIFSGTVQTQPYVVDSSQTSGVRYDGNTGVNTVTIGNGYALQMNLPGTQIFSSASAHVFQAVQDLITSLQNNTAIDTAVGEVRNAFNFVTGQRVFYGNAMNQIRAQQTFLDNQKIQLSSQENTLVGADLAAVASNLVNAQNAQNATLEAIGRQPATSLFDYLK